LDLVFEVLHSSEEFRKTTGFLGKLSFLAFLYHHRIVHWVLDPGEPMGTRKLVYVMLLVVSSSFVLAFLSLKPAEAVARLVFGPRPPPPGSGPPAAGSGDRDWRFNSRISSRVPSRDTGESAFPSAMP